MLEFKKLDVWKESHQFVLLVYSVTKTFDKEEKYGITSQFRRAAVSITNNIAEGCGRKTNKDKAHYLTMARGSTLECQNMIEVCTDLKMIIPSQAEHLRKQATVIAKLQNGFLRYLRS